MVRGKATAEKKTDPCEGKIIADSFLVGFFRKKWFPPEE